MASELEVGAVGKQEQNIINEDTRWTFGTLANRLEMIHLDAKGVIY